jgi:hypothetical protein
VARRAAARSRALGRYAGGRDRRSPALRPHGSVPRAGPRRHGSESPATTARWRRQRGPCAAPRARLRPSRTEESPATSEPAKHRAVMSQYKHKRANGDDEGWTSLVDWHPAADHSHPLLLRLPALAFEESDRKGRRHRRPFCLSAVYSAAAGKGTDRVCRSRLINSAVMKAISSAWSALRRGSQKV